MPRNATTNSTTCRFHFMIEKIISGSQTGADRAALDWAIEHGIPHGGWCPKGRLAEDCPIDARYQLQETPGSSYLQRTEWNVRDADGTVIFSITSGLSGGSKKTLDLAKKHNKPVLPSLAGRWASIAGNGTPALHPCEPDHGAQRGGAASFKRTGGCSLRNAGAGKGIEIMWREPPV